MNQTKKLIEVALPLPEINDASAYDKMPGIGPHPKGIHHWWARLPLPTARAVLFASLVDDPVSHPERWPTEADQNTERERLFGLIRKMMSKKLHEHPEVYDEVQSEIAKHCGDTLPTVFDPFAGGGSIPLEASRLGLKARAGDLNPVAVLLNKCNLELAPRWGGGRAPVNPDSQIEIAGTESWQGTHGLAADVRYYARLVQKRLLDKLGDHYPRVRLAKEQGGGDADVVAWLWARTVASPNPAAKGAHVPLLSTYWLSSVKARPCWLDPVIDKKGGKFHFEIRTDAPKNPVAVATGTKSGKGGFRCLLTDDPIPFAYIRDQGQQGKLDSVLVGVVAEKSHRRVYVRPSPTQVEAAGTLKPHGFPDTDLPAQALGFRVQNYGITKHWQMFSSRQLGGMVTLSDLIIKIPAEVRRDALRAGLHEEEADGYARTVTTFLALALDRCSDFNNTLCRWSPSNQKVMNLFGQQIIRMVWDFAEANLLGGSVGAWATCSNYVADCIEVIPAGAFVPGEGNQLDAAAVTPAPGGLLISTDPPYYDNIGYAALSDFFYVWLRRTVGGIYPDICSTLLVPKLPELTASPERFDGDKHKAKEHFESGFLSAFSAMRDGMDPRFPLTVYYAFKQDDEASAGVSDSDEKPGIDLTTGWETLLSALMSSGFQITGTWPVRASQAWRMRAMGANALASYIVLACRPRSPDAPRTDRRSFVAELKQELPKSLRHLQQGNIAPVDLAQAALGPGMAIYSRYDRIIESTGNAMDVRTALSLIVQNVTEVLSAHEDDFDPDTRWAVSWFEQHGFDPGDFGEAEILSKAKVTAIGGLQQAGIIKSKGGKVCLLRPEDLPGDWDPKKDKRLTVWEMVHHLIRVYCCEQKGEYATAELLSKIGAQGEVARDLAYRLHSISEKRKRSQEAQTYNSLVLAWPELARLMRETGGSMVGQKQQELFEEK